MKMGRVRQGVTDKIKAGEGILVPIWTSDECGYRYLDGTQDFAKCM